MLEFLIGVCILFCCANFVCMVYIYDQIQIIKKQNLDHAIIIAKLMYHVSKDIEDYKTTEMVYSQLADKTNLNRFT
jgi:hypothetical protein